MLLDDYCNDQHPTAPSTRSRAVDKRLLIAQCSPDIVKPGRAACSSGFGTSCTRAGMMRFTCQGWREGRRQTHLIRRDLTSSGRRGVAATTTRSLIGGRGCIGDCCAIAPLADCDPAQRRERGLEGCGRKAEQTEQNEDDRKRCRANASPDHEKRNRPTRASREHMIASLTAILIPGPHRPSLRISN